MRKDFFRQSVVGLKVLVAMTVLLGVVYPAAVWAVGQVALGGRADGQVVQVDGVDRGSAIIGQAFDVADDRWFHGRPSAGGNDGLGSVASNLGPSSPDLLDAIAERRANIATVEGVDPADVPADALTASASGLDPFVSPAYAALQVDRVSAVRGVSVATVRAAVADATSPRQLGFLGQPRVNVLQLNLALERR